MNPEATDFNTYVPGHVFNLQVDGLRDMVHTMESIVEAVDNLSRLINKVIKMEQADHGA
jgi:hypothetical protein